MKSHESRTQDRLVTTGILLAVGAAGTFGFIEPTKAIEDSIATNERIVASVNESVRDD